ncbi:MAG: Trk family potassium uptake protein, partial [Clostridia bacterium]|nr:Trk family potassium uptake protein [Clostridia bacterium]
MEVKTKFKLSSFQIILLGFAAVIFIGAFLLCLPISSKSSGWTSFIDSLFTSTSAVCVTGLVVFDTATHWTIFGQIIILILIQIGGMGIVTVAISFALLSGKKIGLFGRGTMKEAISAPSVGGIVRLVGFIIKGIFVIELIGTLIMLP